MNDTVFTVGDLVISLGAAYGALWAAYEFRYSAAADPVRAARAEALIKLPPTAPASKKFARQLLQASVIYLPLLFALMMINVVRS